MTVFISEFELTSHICSSKERERLSIDPSELLKFYEVNSSLARFAL